MAEGGTKKAGSGGPRIKASAARAHTRKLPANPRIPSTGLAGLVLLSLTFAIAAWAAFVAIQPPPAKVCGSPGSCPVTAPRVALRDGRFLSYMEGGVAKENAKFKIVCVHGYGGSRLNQLPGLSRALVEKLGIYLLSFDRAGYGESTPNPPRNIKSDAYDVQDLADALELGPTFYLAATSIGGYTGWGFMKYLPHRLAGIVMFAPVTNFWWPGIPCAVAKEAFSQQSIGDRMALRVAHYVPWLTYWYMTQKWFPTSSTVNAAKSPMNPTDKEIMGRFHSTLSDKDALYPTLQGDYESKFRDMKVMFGTWEFDPGYLENPFLNKNVSVDIWQGTEDYLVPVILQRYIHQQLPWVHYHELPGLGHILFGAPRLTDKMISRLLLGEETP